MSACCDITKGLIQALCVLVQTFWAVEHLTEVNNRVICKGSDIIVYKKCLVVYTLYGKKLFNMYLFLV